MERKLLTKAREAFEMVIGHYGGQTAFGKKLATFMGRKKPFAQRTVSMWLNETDDCVSPEVAVAIEKMSRGRFGRWQLRPDIFQKPKKNHRASPMGAEMTSAG